MMFTQAARVLTILVGCVVWLLMPCMVRADAVEVMLCKDGAPAFNVVVANGSSDAVRAAAADLAAMLEKITGAKFKIVKSDGATGLAVGEANDFPAIKTTGIFDTEDASQREDYILRTHAGGVHLIGATDDGVRHAVWDFLFRLGYRQFFPGAHWEVIPSTPAPRIALDVKAHPDYSGRRIWYGFGTWKEEAADLAAWNMKNRMGEGLNLHAGHAYDTIYKAKKEEFDKHPEYLCSTKPVKFVASNPGLQKLIADYAVEYFERNPSADCVSLEPSDGGGWDCPEDEKAFKSVTDRVVTLANIAAEAVSKKYKGKYVGIYAYYMHSPPPTIRVHPNVFVGVATGYIKGGYTVDQLMEGWGKQGAKLGMREYYSVVISHKDRPGGPQAADVKRTTANIRKYFEMGARAMSAESSESWGPAGLTYYLVSRLLWDSSQNVDAMTNDFFEKCFGPAQAEMREFYRLIDRGNKPLFSRDLIGRMYRQLDAARKRTEEKGIRNRLDDLTLYTRYVELLWALQESRGKLEESEAALSFSYRIRMTGMVHNYAMWRDTRGGYTRATGITAWDVPEGKNPLKVSDDFMRSEITEFIEKGIANNPIATFTPVTFSDDLVPAAASLKLETPVEGKYGYTRGNQTYFAWFDKPGAIKLEVTAGQISAKGGGSVTINLYAEEDPTAGVASTVTAPIDMQAHSVELATKFTGLHRLEIKDGGRGASVQWPSGAKVTIPTSGDIATLLRGGFDMYFYVPRGTKIIGGFADGSGSLLDPEGKPRPLTGERGYFSVDVPAGMDGKLWKFERGSGRRLLMTVPPYFARSAQELLLPREVIEAEQGAAK